MKVVVFGASGLIGDGFVQESLRADDVTEVVTVGRRPMKSNNPKWRHLVHTDFLDFTPLSEELGSADACFWALGTSSGGVDRGEYERITYGYTAAAIGALETENPNYTFVYVSGGGTDSSEQGRSRWARVKGRTENLVISSFARGYAFRPGFVVPRHDKQSNTTSYRWMLAAVKPFIPVLRFFGVTPVLFTDTEKLGLAALNLARNGWSTSVLENRAINAAAGADRSGRR